MHTSSKRRTFRGGILENDVDEWENVILYNPGLLVDFPANLIEASVCESSIFKEDGQNVKYYESPESVLIDEIESANLFPDADNFAWDPEVK